MSGGADDSRYTSADSSNRVTQRLIRMKRVAVITSCRETFGCVNIKDAVAVRRTKRSARGEGLCSTESWAQLVRTPRFAGTSQVARARVRSSRGRRTCGAERQSTPAGSPQKQTGMCNKGVPRQPGYGRHNDLFKHPRKSSIGSWCRQSTAQSLHPRRKWPRGLPLRRDALCFFFCRSFRYRITFEKYACFETRSSPR